MAVPSPAGPGLAVGPALAPPLRPFRPLCGPERRPREPLSLKAQREAQRAFSCRPGSGGPLLMGLLRRWECGLDGKINFPLEFSFLLPRKESWRGSPGPPGTLPASLWVHEVLSMGCPRVGAVASPGAAHQPEGSAGGREVPCWKLESVGRKFVTS